MPKSRGGRRCGSALNLVLVESAAAYRPAPGPGQANRDVDVFPAVVDVRGYYPHLVVRGVGHAVNSNSPGPGYASTYEAGAARSKSVRSTDSPRPTRTVATISGGNRPCPTTPGVDDSRAASAAGSSTGPW